MFIGDGAKLVRDAFALAKQKAPAIIFIDELDAIGTKRFDSEKSGDREVQRTMLELLNQLDGFGSDERIKVNTKPCQYYGPEQTIFSRLLQPQIESIFLTLHSSDQDVWIERLSSLFLTKLLVLESWKSIRVR
jgi:SpoVK/Ycf46/Vps4 family AAA+-type ATPase